jgi:ADP-heptose:LPS heptosyltransferase
LDTIAIVVEFLKITDKGVRLDNNLYENAILQQGKTYLLRKAHVRQLVNQQVGHPVKGISRCRHLMADALKYHKNPVKVLFFFDGGLGDAISLGVLLKALREQYHMNIDVVCRHLIWSDILKPLGFPGNWIQPPPDKETVTAYDYIQPRGDSLLKDKTNMTGKCILDELATSYKVDLSLAKIRFSIPERQRQRNVIPQNFRPRLGLNFDSKGPIRSYPPKMQPPLVKTLLAAGFELFLFGQVSPNLRGISRNSAIHEFCGKTSVPELASLLAQMDLIISVDSFIAHLANILAVPTIALLSATRRGIFARHEHVVCLESVIECAPCGEVNGPCPIGYDECQAFYHHSITAEKITITAARQTAEILQKSIRKHCTA